MHALAAELYPICRSITGDGVRETLQRIGARSRSTSSEVPTGTPVLRLDRARASGTSATPTSRTWRGERVVDFRAATCTCSATASRSPSAHAARGAATSTCYSLPEQPDWIPYRTSYYQEAWGFCLSAAPARGAARRRVRGRASTRRSRTAPDLRRVPARGRDRGRGADLVPRLPPVAVQRQPLRDRRRDRASRRALRRCPAGYSYRFLFIPGTIGSITWLARNEARAERIKHGLVLTCVGDAGRPTYKRSRRGDARDRPGDGARAAPTRASDHEIQDFMPWGYDERQYCSPGFDLPVGCLMRTPHGRFPEYHTSADDLEFVARRGARRLVRQVPGGCSTSWSRTAPIVNTNPNCEPQLGRRGLYDAIGGRADREQAQLAMLWVLNQSDGDQRPARHRGEVLAAVRADRARRRDPARARAPGRGSELAQDVANQRRQDAAQRVERELPPEQLVTGASYPGPSLWIRTALEHGRCKRLRGRR